VAGSLTALPLGTFDCFASVSVCVVGQGRVSWYELRRKLVAKDPWAVMQNFTVSIKLLLPRLLGCNMCPYCPHCNGDDECSPCLNKFGHAHRPLGGIAGLATGFGGSVEYQLNDNPHFHGNVHLVSLYQYMTLFEIAALMESNLISLQEISSWQSWVCREEHFDHDAHQASLPELETAWKQHNSDVRAWVSELRSLY